MNHLRESNAYIERFTLGQGDLRFAVKDTLDVAGHATQAGCRALALAPPALRHAQIVDTLLNQRCILTGKTTLHELAFGVTGINPWSGTPLNPQYPQLIPGGSSSGSAAAVAAGEVDFAIGTDTGAPVLGSAVANFDCEINEFHEVGSHTVFYCRVQEVRVGECPRGLVYFNRRYYDLAEE
ncbi:conserved hypothetical protein [Enterobacterales bacterium 8AC]|nr:conserved hypothetical protein [Enterobacterales bacterium 8AC]